MAASGRAAAIATLALALFCSVEARGGKPPVKPVPNHCDSLPAKP
jgi:hypothetical protein